MIKYLARYKNRITKYGQCSHYSSILFSIIWQESFPIFLWFNVHFVKDVKVLQIKTTHINNSTKALFTLFEHRGIYKVQKYLFTQNCCVSIRLQIMKTMLYLPIKNNSYLLIMYLCKLLIKLLLHHIINYSNNLWHTFLLNIHNKISKQWAQRSVCFLPTCF